MNAPPTTPPTIEGVRVDVRGVHKSYQGQPVLEGIDLAIAAGETFAVMGPSGSGKTVLLKHLIGLETPDQGDILIAGQPVEQPGMLDHYRLAMVFQSGALLNSLTVTENVGLYLTEHRLKPPAEIARIVAAKLDLVGLAAEGNRYPEALSGGMKKRVAIARALVIDPQLILYDEPTSELDPLMAVTVVQEMLKLKHRLRATSIVVTHDRDLAFAVADRIAIIHQGRIRAVGRPDEIRRASDPFVQEFLSVAFAPTIPLKSL